MRHWSVTRVVYLAIPDELRSEFCSALTNSKTLTFDSAQVVAQRLSNWAASTDSLIWHSITNPMSTSFVFVAGCSQSGSRERELELNRRSLKAKMAYIEVGILAVVGIVVVAAIPAIGAENIRLHFDVYKNGAQLATPTVAVEDSKTGSFQLADATISFTPSRLDANKVAVAFDVESGERKLTPRLVLLDQEIGSVAWNSVSGSFEIRVSSLR